MVGREADHGALEIEDGSAGGLAAGARCTGDDDEAGLRVERPLETDAFHLPIK